MAPSLEEPTQVDFDAPLKAAPKLVAPEPGTLSPATPPNTHLSSPTLMPPQSTAQVPNRNKQV
jgi:hypothetical protein